MGNIYRGEAEVNIITPRVNKSYIHRKGMEYLFYSIPLGVQGQSTDQTTAVDLLVLALFLLAIIPLILSSSISVNLSMTQSLIFCCAYFYFRRLLALTVDGFLVVLLQQITLLLVLA